MSSAPGHIELRRTLDSIHIGARHRTDLGNVDGLAESIDQDGLWQLITIDPDGNLVCGRRRLAAMRTLGWKVTDVWVRPVSGRLGQLLAERDDDEFHKSLTPTEQASLYRELKTVMAENAAHRQEATRFGAPGRGGENGGANLAPPAGEGGKARAQAARMVTGRNSYTTLERIGRLQELAADESQPEAVRAAAAAELDGIDAGAGVYPAFQRVGAELSLAELDQLAADSAQPAGVREQARAEAAQVREAERVAKAAELESIAADALARVRAAGKKKPKAKPAPMPSAWERRTLRAFVLTWEDMAGWWEHYDPAEVGPALTDEQWAQFEATVAGSAAFADAARAARADAERRTA